MKRQVAERAFGEWPAVLSVRDVRGTRQDLYSDDRHRRAEKSQRFQGSERKENPWTAPREFIYAFIQHHKHITPEPPQKDPFQDLQKQFDALQSRVSRIEQILEGVDEPSYVDPNLDWCQTNIEKLKQFPNSFVAIDTKKGEIVVHSADQDEFIRKLELLSHVTRSTLFRTHTSQFLKPSDV